MFSKDRISVQQIKKLMQSDYFILFLIAAIYVVIISVLALSRHYMFYTNAWDLGIYSQSLYSTINHGKLLYYTAEATGNPTGSIFGIHFSPFLFLLLPIYAIFQNPITLLILRPIAISIGLIPLYWIIRDQQLNNRIMTVFLAAIYVIYPPMTTPLSNFDTTVFLPALFLFAIHYLRKGKLARSFIFIVLALMINEFVPLIVTTFAVYVVIINRKEIFSGLRAKRATKHAQFAIALVVSAFIFLSVASVVITSFNPEALSTKWEWGELGSSPSEIVGSVLTNPAQALRVLFNDGASKFLYLTALFAPLAFLSFLEPVTLIMTVPWLVASLLSINPLYYALGTHYPAFVSAFIFVSAISGIKKIINTDNKQALKKLAWLMTTCLILSTFLLPTGNYVSATQTDDQIRLALNEIPANASIATMPEIFPHVPSRLNVYPYFKSGVEYVLININSWWYSSKLPRPNHLAPKWCDVELDDYGLVINSNGVLLYKKGYTGPVKEYSGINVSYNYKYVNVATGDVTEDNVTIGSKVIKNTEVLIHNESHLTPLFFRVPDKAIPPGDYTITFKFKASSITSNEVIKIDVLDKPESSQITFITINGSDFILADRWQAFTFSLTIEEPTLVEYVIYVTGATDVSWYSLNVVQVAGGV